MAGFFRVPKSPRPLPRRTPRLDERRRLDPAPTPPHSGSWRKRGGWIVGYGSNTVKPPIKSRPRRDVRKEGFSCSRK